MIQGIRNINDMDLFQRFFGQTVHAFDTEFDKKIKYLSVYMAKTERELSEIIERRKIYKIKLLNQAGKSNLLMYKNKN